MRWIITHLEDTAKQVWRNAAIPHTAVLTWDILRSTLQRGLGTLNTEWDAKNKLMLLRQTGTLPDYIKKFRSLLHDLSAQPLSDAERVHRFWSGLKPSLRAACMVDPSNHNQPWAAGDFEKLVSFALNIDRCSRSLQIMSAARYFDH